MSKDMKMIMEGWRKYSTVEKTEQQVLEEGMKETLAALMMGLGLSYSPNAIGAGFEAADEATMSVVADALEVLSKKDASLKDAAELAKDIADNPASNLSLGDLEKSQISDGYLIDQFASQVKTSKDLENLKSKLKKLKGDAPEDTTEKEDDKETMQHRMRRVNKGALDFVKQ